MSTLLYADLTTQRQEATPGGGPSPADSKPSTKKYADTVAALVPAEVISLAAIISSLTVTVTPGAGGESTSKIDYPNVVEYSFYALLVLSAVLFLIRKSSHRTGVDYVRALIPPAAFACWTMLQANTAIDVIAPDFAGVPATVTALILAVVLGAASNSLATRAQNADPQSMSEMPPVPAPADD